MGKGYNNYMTKKPFHPGSKANIKRTWMAEQRTENEKRKQEELKAQYDKEQDLYNNRALLSTESKDKLELNFMYEAPPGAKRERQKEDDEPEYKFEWQRKYSAPREDYAKGNAEIRDQPFGIPVRNVRCIKCHKWGHINTDKECPLYSHASSSSMPTTSMDPLELMRQMREDGYDLKKSALGHQHNPKQANQQFIPSDDESDPEMDFLKSLTPKQKRILLRKLNRLSKKQKKKDENKKKNKKKQKAKSKKRAAESDAESDQKSEQKKKKKKKKEKFEPSDTESTDSSDDEEGKTNLTPKERKAKATNDTTTKKAISSDTKHHKMQEKNKKTKSDASFIKNSHEEEEILSLKKIKRNMSTSDGMKKSSNDTKSEKSSSTKEKNSSDVAESDSHKSTSDKKTNETEASGSGTSVQDSSTKSTSSNKASKHKNPSTKSNSSSSDEDSSEGTKTEGKRSKSKRSRKDFSSSCSENKEVLKSSQKPSVEVSSEASTSKVTDDASKSNTMDENYHPDGFDPVYPQRTGKSSDVDSKHDGNLRDRFRDRHRHRRSPSVKHKYRHE